MGASCYRVFTQDGPTERCEHILKCRAEERDILPPIDKAQVAEALELLPFERRPEGEGEVGEGLHGEEARGPHGGLQAAIVGA